MVAPQPPVIPSGALSNKDCHNITESETMYSTRREYNRFLNLFSFYISRYINFNNFVIASHMHDMSYNFDEESSLDVSSPRCLNSPSVSIFISIHLFR